MTRTIAVDELRIRCDELLRDLEQSGEEFWIERDGQVVARLVSTVESAGRALADDEFDALLAGTRWRNRHVPPEIIEAEVAEALAAVRSGAWPPA
ncbi:MAG: type II toxin-antitoxin system Phd/YefM family antitoxin [Dehalococcoidia bacterium]